MGGGEGVGRGTLGDPEGDPGAPAVALPLPLATGEAQGVAVAGADKVPLRLPPAIVTEGSDEVEPVVEALGGAGDELPEKEGSRDARADAEPAARDGEGVGEPVLDKDPSPSGPGEAEAVLQAEAVGGGEDEGAPEGGPLGLLVAANVLLPTADAVRAAPKLGELLPVTVPVAVGGAAEGVFVPPEAHAVGDSEAVAEAEGGAGEALPVRVPPSPAPTAVPLTLPVEEPQGLRLAEDEPDGEGECEGERVSLLLPVPLPLPASLAVGAPLEDARGLAEAKEAEARKVAASDADAGDRDGERVPPRWVAEKAAEGVPVPHMVGVPLSLPSALNVGVMVGVVEGAPAPDAEADRQREALSVPLGAPVADGATEAEVVEERQRLGEALPEAGGEGLPEGLPEAEEHRVELAVSLPWGDTEGDREALGDGERDCVPRALAQGEGDTRALPLGLEAEGEVVTSLLRVALTHSDKEGVEVRERPGEREPLEQLDAEPLRDTERVGSAERLREGDGVLLVVTLPVPLRRPLREGDVVLEVEGEPEVQPEAEGEPVSLGLPLGGALREAAPAGLPEPPLREALPDGAPEREKEALLEGEGDALGEALPRELALAEREAALEAERLYVADSVIDCVPGAVGGRDCLELPLLVNDGEAVGLDDWLDEAVKEGVGEGPVEREGDEEAEGHTVP